jgi:NAD(P)-dependent dehydrogenase (short-subunit alcohol dehydrogenase family)
MPTVLITGANRGIGLEFARQYSADDWDVVATVREHSEELDSLGVRVERLDMRNLDAVAGFSERLQVLDLLIANAGTYGPRSPDSGKEGEEWLETFAVNTVAPYLLAKSVLPLVTEKQGKLIAITSRMGSIDALNSAWKSLALDNRGKVSCAVLHPGWVQTRMGGSSAPLAPEDSVSGMRKVIEDLSPADSGSFFSYDGSRIPW